MIKIDKTTIANYDNYTPFERYGLAVILHESDVKNIDPNLDLTLSKEFIDKFLLSLAENIKLKKIGVNDEGRWLYSPVTIDDIKRDKELKNISTNVFSPVTNICNTQLKNYIEYLISSDYLNKNCQLKGSISPYTTKQISGFGKSSYDEIEPLRFLSNVVSCFTNKKFSFREETKDGWENYGVFPDLSLTDLLTYLDVFVHYNAVNITSNALVSVNIITKPDQTGKTPHLYFRNYNQNIKRFKSLDAFDILIQIQNFLNHTKDISLKNLSDKLNSTTIYQINTDNVKIMDIHKEVLNLVKKSSTHFDISVINSLITITDTSLSDINKKTIYKLGVNFIKHFNIDSLSTLVFSKKAFKYNDTTYPIFEHFFLTDFKMNKETINLLKELAENINKGVGIYAYHKYKPDEIREKKRSILELLFKIVEKSDNVAEVFSKLTKKMVHYDIFLNGYIDEIIILVETGALDFEKFKLVFCTFLRMDYYHKKNSDSIESSVNSSIEEKEDITTLLNEI